MSCHVTNCPIPPIEATEAECPVLYVQRELQTGTGGAGKWRGGVGQVLAYKILGDLAELQHTSQKSVTLPQGVAGGLPGGGGRWVINEGQPNARVLEHSIGELEMLDYGDIVTTTPPAGVVSAIRLREIRRWSSAMSGPVSSRWSRPRRYTE